MSGPDDVAALAAAVGLDPPVYRRADVERQVGVPHADMVRWWRAMGFAEVPEDEVAFGRDDVRMATDLASLLASGRVDDLDVLRLARVLGSSFSRIAEAQVSLLEDVDDEGGGADGVGSEGTDPGRSLEDAELLELLETSLVYVWRRHLVAALGRRLRVEAADEALRADIADPDTTTEARHEDHGTSATTVGFVDIAGFSRLSKRLDVEELGDIVDRFEAGALDVVAEHDGRVVKFIGDAVMYVAPDLEAGVRIGLDLQERAKGSDVPLELHCGVAHGPTITMGGDVFGPTVNLASRLTDVARRGTAVIPRECAHELDDRPDLLVKPVRRPYDLKGIGRTRLATVARRPEERDAPASRRRDRRDRRAG
ncbi:adenylate/guanylate cyclase domain-containing protein [Dermatobacter hominis]|uniref:adenylate/guanylate cyclase domain-containing protein n=1 Tax=Dermatobacter hominis TaxID=2884263 RepID=UPI001D1111D8|nr:adenylate/guanylate cyclase domain-containing protein [Dermatobacter hominis]UDY36538.1 adenylate/guanylate cyclase domain-containing protein [Dermatobacter hominis]